MASVAGCPRCSHELLIPNGANPNAWAECPACNAFFQVKDAAVRDVAELRLVDTAADPAAADDADAPVEPARDEVPAFDPTRTVPISSEKTLGDIASLAGNSGVALLDVTVGDAAEPIESPKRSAPTIEDFATTSAPTWEEAAPEGGPVPIAAAEPPAEATNQYPPLSDSVEAAAERIEKWFHSAKTVPDVGPLLSDVPPPESELVASGEVDAVAESPVQTDVTAHDLTPADSGAAAARTIADIPIPPIPTSARAGATIEISGSPSGDANTDFELESSPEPPQMLAPWDDSEHIERLLAGNEGHPTDDATTTLATPPAAAEAEPTDQPYINSEMFAMPTSPRRRRRSSLVRALAGIVVSGVVGLGLGYVLLLWLLGTNGDFLQIAQYLPSTILPVSFSTAPSQLAVTPAPHVDPDTVPAGFDTPATTTKSLADDVAKVQSPEPSQFEPSDATPLAGGEMSHVTDAVSFAADQLAVALQTAKDAQPGLVKGDLGDGEAVQRAKGYSYSMLCDLADKATFVDAAPRPDYVAALWHEADELFRETLSNAHTRGEVARIVPKWIGSKYRKHGGVFFAGTVIGETSKGQVVECRVDLGAGEPLTILVPAAMAKGLDNSGRPLGIVGSIVDSPAQHVSGYDGDAPQAVWVGRLIPLD